MPLELVLYVNPTSPTSIRAKRDLEAFLAVHPSACCQLVVRDVTQCSSELEEDRVLYTPTLVVKGDGPTSWLVGDLKNPETLAAALHLTSPPPRSQGDRAQGGTPEFTSGVPEDSP